jgi:hypothetical protein
MPTRAGDPDLRPVPRRTLKGELWAISPLDSLSSQIRGLTLRRQDVYARAQAHQQGGQIIPLSLCEELAENGSQLRIALDRYTEEKGRPPG